MTILKNKAAIVSGLAIAIATIFVPKHEGRNLVAYLDPIGIPTICEGWTRGVKLGDKATVKQCDELTQKGLQDANDIFVGYIPESVRAELSPYTYAAFLSFIYNVGPGKPGVKDGFVYLKNGRNSTMITLLRKGDILGACAQLKYWTSAGGKVFKGLIYRRTEETKLCLTT